MAHLKEEGIFPGKLSRLRKDDGTEFNENELIIVLSELLHELFLLKLFLYLNLLLLATITVIVFCISPDFFGIVIKVIIGIMALLIFAMAMFILYYQIPNQAKRIKKIYLLDGRYFQILKKMPNRSMAQKLEKIIFE